MIFHLIPPKFYRIVKNTQNKYRKIFKGLTFAKIIIKIKEVKKDMFTN